MLVTGIAVGLIGGFLLGGSVANLLTNTRRLRWLGLLALGAIVRFGTEIALNAGVPGVAEVRLPLFTFAFGLLLAGCWANRRVAGFGLVLVGTLANLVPVMLNGGAMPICCWFTIPRPNNSSWMKATARRDGKSRGMISSSLGRPPIRLM